jgi:hypothetical protein
MVAYERIRTALGSRLPEFRTVLSRLDVLTPGEGVISVLDVGSHGNIPKNRLIVHEGVGSGYVEGAYFYYFAPHTFATAS